MIQIETLVKEVVYTLVTHCKQKSNQILVFVITNFKLHPLNLDESNEINNLKAFTKYPLKDLN